MTLPLNKGYISKDGPNPNANGRMKKGIAIEYKKCHFLMLSHRIIHGINLYFNVMYIYHLVI